MQGVRRPCPQTTEAQGRSEKKRLKSTGGQGYIMTGTPKYTRSKVACTENQMEAEAVMKLH